MSAGSAKIKIGLQKDHPIYKSSLKELTFCIWQNATLTMTNHIVQKFFRLIAVYCLIILGIFAIQFRNEILINKNIGSLKLSLHEINSPDKKNTLKNVFQVVFRGITFYAEAKSTVLFYDSNGTSEKGVLTNYEINDNTLSLQFDNTCEILFSVNGKDENENLYIHANLSENISKVALPCKPVATYNLESLEKNGFALISGKDSQFLLNSQLDKDNFLCLTQNDNYTSYGLYNPAANITYEMLASFPYAGKDTYDTIVKQFRNTFVSAYKVENIPSSSEKEITAYLAESAIQGKYKPAIASVNASFKQDSKKTYLSSPYLNNLINTNKTLVSYNNSLLYKIQQSIDNNTLEAFEIDKLISVLIYKNNLALANQLFSLPVLNEIQTPTIPQITGILNTYTDLFPLSKETAAKINPVIDNILDYLLTLFSTNDDETVVLSTENGDASVSESCRLAAALIRYGKLISNENIEATGYLLANSVLQTIPKETSVLSDLYPVLVENDYYPHFTVLSQGTTNITAWTCSPNVTLEKQGTNQLVLSTTFPVGDSQYLIITGLKAFNYIEIYGLNYRSDKRFESYNSAGYVYDKPSQTLFLKMRHKSETEKIIFTY